MRYLALTDHRIPGRGRPELLNDARLIGKPRTARSKAPPFESLKLTRASKPNRKTTIKANYFLGQRLKYRFLAGPTLSPAIPSYLSGRVNTTLNLVRMNEKSEACGKDD